MSSPPRSLCVDETAHQNFAAIISGLRSARLNAGLTQETLASGLPVRARAISQWETGAVEPTLGNLIRWSYALDHSLVITDHKRKLVNGPVHQPRGESREIFERRRLATPLRNRRHALRMTQEELSQLIGVSRDSVQRWELAWVPPRPISHVVWAQMLGYTLGLRPIDLPDQTARHLTTERVAVPTGQHEHHR